MKAQFGFRFADGSLIAYVEFINAVPSFIDQTTESIKQRFKRAFRGETFRVMIPVKSTEDAAKVSRELHTLITQEIERYNSKREELRQQLKPLTWTLEASLEPGDLWISP